MARGDRISAWGLSWGLSWGVGGAVACLPALCALTQIVRAPPPAAEEMRLLFQSDGVANFASRPAEGYDAFTPIDSECQRYGYQYRVHLPALAGPLCAIFYEDDLQKGEELLADLGVRKTIRFAVTPVSQAAGYPPPESVRGKERVSPQEYVRSGEEIARRVAELNKQHPPSTRDARFTRTKL
jgi:hypothetical protein